MRRIYPEMVKSPIWTQYAESWGVEGSSEDDVAAKAERLWTFVIEPDENASASELVGIKSDFAWIWAVIAGLWAASYTL